MAISVVSQITTTGNGFYFILSNFNMLKFIFDLFFCVCACRLGTQGTTYRDQFSFHHMGYGYGTCVTGLGDRYLCPQSHLAIEYTYCYNHCIFTFCEKTKNRRTHQAKTPKAVLGNILNPMSR